MNDHFSAGMRRAALLTSASNVAEATRVIQDMLAGRSASGEPAPADHDITPPPAKPRSRPFQVDPDAEIVEPSAKPAADEGVRRTGGVSTSPRMRKPLGEVLRVLREGRSAIGASVSMPDISLQGMGLPGMAKHSPSVVVPVGAQFLTRSFTCAAGTRSYRLYVPASAPDRPRGLVVMLHGCKQGPEDFAVGTGMNAVAEAHGLMVAYPGQTGADNPSSCWNWFRPQDQRRDAGEPSIIAGITAEIMSEFNLDRSGVFVAGLSAGGAMAAVMGETYSDLYAAVGIHSGLACGTANDVMSAFSAMRGDGGIASHPKPGTEARGIRTIVFQGRADGTVHPSNAERIVAAAAPTGAECAVRRQTGRSDGGRTFTRTIVADHEGMPAVECWMVDGAGHAWSGGHAGGSYTDPLGPDAAREMVRFFLNRQD